MPGFFGSSGFRPDKGMTKTQNELLSQGPLQEGWTQLNKRNADGSMGKAQYVRKPAPQFSYKPGGDSEYNVLQYGNSAGRTGRLGDNQFSQSQTPVGPTSYQPFQYKTPDITSSVGPAYEGIKQGGIEAAQMGARAGMQQGMGLLGRRGIQGGGMQNMMLNRQGALASRNIADVSRQSDLAAAQAADQARYQQAQMDMQRQQAQAGEGQFGANMGQRQYEFMNNLAMQKRQADVEEMMRQAELDRMMRAEKYGMYRQPYEDMLRQYQINLPYASKSQPGLLSRGMGAVAGLGNMASSVGGMF